MYLSTENILISRLSIHREPAIYYITRQSLKYVAIDDALNDPSASKNYMETITFDLILYEHCSLIKTWSIVCIASVNIDAIAYITIYKIPSVLKHISRQHIKYKDIDDIYAAFRPYLSDTKLNINAGMQPRLGKNYIYSMFECVRLNSAIKLGMNYVMTDLIYNATAVADIEPKNSDLYHPKEKQLSIYLILDAVFNRRSYLITDFSRLMDLSEFSSIR
eukprot:Mrub_07336.p2 GENE.Mrub_07336~~Mrub_07336.p2  ORF type:complete len:219 (+),score=-7.82 Mrub_07336:210-866(+)